MIKLLLHFCYYYHYNYYYDCGLWLLLCPIPCTPAAIIIWHGIDSARRLALFHKRGWNLATELSLWPGQSCGIVYWQQFITWRICIRLSTACHFLNCHLLLLLLLLSTVRRRTVGNCSSYYIEPMNCPFCCWTKLCWRLNCPKSKNLFSLSLKWCLVTPGWKPGTLLSCLQLQCIQIT